MLAALAWRNLWRRPVRTGLSLASIALVTALLVFILSFQGGVYSAMKETTLRIFDGYAELQPAGYADDPTLERVIVEPDRLARAAERLSGVSVASLRVNAFAVLAHGPRSYGAAVVGVDPAREARLSSMAAAIRTGRYLVPGDTDSAILGDALARNLGVALGGDVTLLGAARDGSVAADVLRVVGIYHSGLPELDRSILEMPLARARDDFAMAGAANTIALGGRSLDAVNTALPALRRLIDGDVPRSPGAEPVTVRDWADLEPAVHDAIDLKYGISLTFYATLIVVVAFIVLNTLLMSVLERTREFGTLLALGMRPGRIGAMVWMELLGLALLGCAGGLLVGGGVTAWFQVRGLVYPIDPRLLAQFGVPSRLYPALTPFSALLGPGALLAAIGVGGLVPYLRVIGLTPALAMRAA